MKKKIALVPLLASIILMTGCSGNSEKKDQTNDENKLTAETDAKLNKHDVSYALGYNVGDVLSKTDPELSMDDLIKGIQDAYNKNPSPRMQEEEIQKLLMHYNLEISKAMKEKHESDRLENIRKGTAFRTEYASKEGVKKDDKGFLYKVVENGKGPKPKKEDVVVVEYEGKKIDGTPFFSSKTQGQPAQFAVSTVIKGWMDALQEMPVGSTWEIVVPPELAYGDRGAGDVIGPGETLVFEIHLLNIKDDKAEESEEKAQEDEEK